MKKKILLIGAVLLLTIMGVVGLSACKKPLDDYQLVKNKISFIQRAVYSGESDKYKIRISVGDKEKDLIADGNAQNIQPFTQITMIPKDLKSLNKTFAYKLVGQSGEATGSLVKSILGVSFSAYVSEGGASLGVLKSITITTEDSQDVINLDNALKDCISADKALEYAYKAAESEIKACIKDGVFDREVNVKYINDRNNSATPHYWYVSFMKDTNNIISVLINPQDGGIISIKR